MSQWLGTIVCIAVTSCHYKKGRPPLKPDAHVKEKQEEHLESAYETSLKYKLIYVAHIFFIVPFLGYIVYKRKQVHPNTYIILGVLTAFTLMYHGVHMMYSV